MQKITFYVFLPANIIINKVNNNIRNVISYFNTVENLRKENIKLKQELSKYKRKTNILYEYRLQNERLTKLLHLKRNFSYKTISSNVIYSENNTLFQNIIIDVGKKNNVKEGMAVITDEGLIGRIYKVFNNYSQVLLITNYRCKIGAILQNSRRLGLLQGNGENCVLKYIPEEVNVKIGEKVVTAAAVEYIPKGILIGKVIKVKKREGDISTYIEVKPMVNLTKLEEVLVIVAN